MLAPRRVDEGAGCGPSRLILPAPSGAWPHLRLCAFSPIRPRDPSTGKAAVGAVPARTPSPPEDHAPSFLACPDELDRGSGGFGRNREGPGVGPCRGEGSGVKAPDAGASPPAGGLRRRASQRDGEGQIYRDVISSAGAGFSGLRSPFLRPPTFAEAPAQATQILLLIL